MKIVRRQSDREALSLAPPKKMHRAIVLRD